MLIERESPPLLHGKVGDLVGGGRVIKKGSFYLLYSESPSGTEKADSKLAHTSKKRGCHLRELSPVKATLGGSQINFAPEANMPSLFFRFSFLAIPVLPAYFFS